MNTSAGGADDRSLGPTDRAFYASDVGLVVQGTLILLSAIIAVLGYVVQNRLKEQARLKERERDRVERYRHTHLKHEREMLHEIIGPLQGLVQLGSTMIQDFGMSVESIEKRPEYWLRCSGSSEDLQRNMRSEGALSTGTPFLTPGIVSKIDGDPGGHLARQYRSTMRSAMRTFFSPASELICQHMNSLSFPTREEFIRMYPNRRGDPQLRKTMLLQFAGWTAAMNQLIEEEWDKGDFSHTFPPFHQFPNRLVPYLVHLLDSCRETIKKLTDGEIAFGNVPWEVEIKSWEMSKKGLYTVTEQKEKKSV